MAANSKRVFTVVPPVSPVFTQVLERRPDITLQRILPGTPLAEGEPVLAGAHAYQIGATRDEMDPTYLLTADLLARMPTLLVVSSNGSGSDTIDIGACTAAGVLAVNQAGGNREAVAEHVLGMMLALTKRIVDADRVMRRQAGIRRNEYAGRDIYGRTIGIVGFGHVGTRIAELCRGLFAMRVLAADPYLTDEAVRAKGAERVPLDQLLAESDFVSINCPLNAETRGMIGAAQYARMKKTAYFIQAARGSIHDEAALAVALRDGQIAGAGLDVWEKEPPPPDHPLLAFDNVLVSPHTAGVTHEARENMGRIAAEQIIAILEGARPERLMNPEVWPAYRERFARVFGYSPRE